MTPLTDDEELTRQSYEEQGSNWAAARSNTIRFKNDVAYLKKLLPKGRILEIGCGHGRDAKLLAEAGYNYLGTDISATLLKIAQQHNPDLKFEKVSLYDLNYKRKFDGFWCVAVLLHVPKERISEALQAIRRNIKPGGFGFIVVKHGQGQKVVSGSPEIGRRFYAFWEANELSPVLAKNGFEIIKQHSHEYKGDIWLQYHLRVN